MKIINYYSGPNFRVSEHQKNAGLNVRDSRVTRVQ